MSQKRTIIIPTSYARSGGPEALHQLANELNCLDGVEALTYYVGPREPDVVAEFHRHYKIRETTRADIPGATIVVADTMDPNLYPTPVAGAKWIWWLAAQRHFPLERYRNCGHLFQSDFARLQLEQIGYSGLMLTDYLRETFASADNASPKKDIVAYNGTKSPLAAIRLKLACPSLRMVAIRQLSHEQVMRVLDEAKIYLDMGWHPGRDRMPREAALRGCLVVTNREGAAGNSVDVPIPDDYKLDADDEFALADKLRLFLSEYDRRRGDFDLYRKWVMGQRQAFHQEAKEFAAVCANPATGTTLTADELAEALDASFLESEETLRSLRGLVHQCAIRLDGVLGTSPVYVRILRNINATAARLRRVVDSYIFRGVTARK
jgi:hypothetical protein